MKKRIMLGVAFLWMAMAIIAQVGVNTDNSAPDNSAMLDVKSISRGLLVPRMTGAQRDLIASPANGLLIFCTDNNQYYFNQGTPAAKNWVMLNSQWLTNGTSIYFSDGNVGIGTSNPAASASLEISSTSKGLLPPRMTMAQRDAIVNPTAGLLVFCTNCNSDGAAALSIYSGGFWRSISLTCKTPVPPPAGSPVQTTGQIIWNWNAVPIADGYKWCATSDYVYATDMGTATTKTETGLTSGYSYTRYVWSYNECGHAEPTVLVGQALTCGSAFTRTHSSGAFAPVQKTVTYGTATNIPGATSKCWITRNLGASQQATAVNDATEASAGWYWQFNTKQGYKYDGSTRTPNTDWIISIDENSDWSPVNDPCTRLLGNEWRIPTYEEWYSVDNSGGWTSWSGPWNSALKMHAAGWLDMSSGSVYNRGSEGQFWTNQQNGTNATVGIFLDFDNNSCDFWGYDKAYGMSIRCFRE
jgi:hypothetical protein